MELEGMSPVLPVTTVTADADASRSVSLCIFLLKHQFLWQHDYVWVCKTVVLLLDTWIAYKRDVGEKGAYVQKIKGGHVGWRKSKFNS